MLAGTGFLAAPALALPGLDRPAELRALLHRDLFQGFLPFMERHVIDREYGGFLCDTDCDGTHADTYKTPLNEGRGIWVYSFLYTHFGRDERYLDVARRSVALLQKSRPADGEFWSARLNREGTPVAPPAATMPGDLAVCEGLAAYALATKSQEPLDRARQLLNRAVEAYDRADYNPGAGKIFLGPDAPPTPGARNVGSWMLLLRCAAQIREADRNARTTALADRAVEAVLQHHFNPACRLNNEILPHDLSAPAAPFDQLVYFGHTIEITWMLLEEALYRRDPAMFQMVTERFRRHVDVATDRVYGGVFHNLRNVDANRWLLDKVLWAQLETLIDALLVAEHTGAAWARDLFDSMNAYVRSKWTLQQHGSPLWMYAADRRATFASFAAMPKRVEHYHYPRHLMLDLLRLDRL